jgi:hypothetical protein
MIKTLSIQAATLSAQPSDHAAWAALTDQGYATRQGLITASQGLLGQIAMVDLEISVGRLGPGDLKRISGELQSLMFRATWVAFLVCGVGADYQGYTVVCMRSRFL